MSSRQKITEILQRNGVLTPSVQLVDELDNFRFAEWSRGYDEGQYDITGGC